MTAEATTLPVDVAQPDDAQFVITDLAPTARALVALKSTQTEQALLAMAAKHSGLVEIKDKAGREQVHGAAMELMRARTTVKRLADEVRDDAKKFNAAVIAEEKRLTAIVEPEELRLKALRDGYDAEQERIKREAEEKERARVLALGARIQEIRGFARLAQDCRSSDAVRRLVERLGSIDMTGFAEFEAEAINVLTETRQQVEQVLNARMATEAETARLKSEREELARQQAEAKQKADELAAQQKAMADAVREIAGVGLALADELLEIPTHPGGPLQFTTEEIAALKDFQAAPLEFNVIRALPDADLVDTASPIVIGIDMGTDAPLAGELIGVISDAFGVDTETACRWLVARSDDFEVWAVGAWAKNTTTA